jgi:hypothetical protein
MSALLHNMSVWIFSLGNEKGEILEQVVGLKVPISGQKLRTKGKISKFNYLKVS